MLENPAGKIAEINTSSNLDVLQNPLLLTLVQKLRQDALTTQDFVEQFNQLSQSTPEISHNLPISDQEINPDFDKLFDKNRAF